MKFEGVDIVWLGHSGFKLKNSKVVYIDPYKIKGNCEKADLILITHDHYDHCSLEDINKIVKPGVKIILPVSCQSKINKLNVPVKMILMSKGQEYFLEDIKIISFPAYNIYNNFHLKEDGGIGYLIKLNKVLIYHSGDTDKIPEMRRLTGYNQEGKKFVALLPVGGRFTMNAEEAVEVAKLIKPNIAIPMHYGCIVGNYKDAEEFKELCEENKIHVEILEKE
jgi:L-ascorbate metabolism protein UlaG (beta-lactamase superfamily)